MREINMAMVSQERLLYIESASDLAEAFKHKMNEAGFDVDIASDGTEGLQLCNINTYDIVIAEYKIPGIDGLEVIRRLSLMGPIPASVMLTAYGDERIAVEAMKLGASEYIVKDKDGRYLELFPAVIQRLRQQRLLLEAKQHFEDSQQAIIQGLRDVVGIADQLIACPDMDQLFHRTIELIQKRLGIERCSLFLADESETVVQGTYGIDLNGNIIDESDFSTEITPQWLSLLRPKRRLGDSLWRVTNGAHKQWNGSKYEEVGDGWIVSTPIHSISGPIGVFFNDTCISQDNIDDVKQELLVVFCSVLGNIIERKRADAALQQVNEELEKRVNERTQVLVEMNQDRQKLSRRLMDVQETERRAIARELHDEIGQALTAVKMNLQAIAMVSHATPQLEDAMSIVERSLQQVRDISLNLRPSMLDDLGLVPALRWYLDRQAQRAGLKPHFSADEITIDISSEIESTCFRVAQEALTNVIRHAQAEHVFMEIREGDHEVILIIRDDGVGFDVEKAKDRATKGASLGVLGMQERVHLINGEINLESVPPFGTEVWVSIPIPENLEFEKEEGTD